MSSFLRPLGQLFTRGCLLSKFNSPLPATTINLATDVSKSRFYSNSYTAYEVIDDKKEKQEAQGISASVETLVNF